MSANGATLSRSPIRVALVEDSPLQRAHLMRIIQADGDIEVVAQATSARQAPGCIAQSTPDVVAFGLQVPDRGSQEAIRQVMASTPTAILVLCPQGMDPGSGLVAAALLAGALDALPNPGEWSQEEAAQLRRCLRGLHKLRELRPAPGRQRPLRPRPSATQPPVVALAASTGGPPALARVLGGLAGLNAPVLVVQHIHPEFVDGLISWMSKASALPVEVARHGQSLLPGHVYFGPGGSHLLLDQGGRAALAEEPQTLHRPSANELFRSVAEHAGASGVGVAMTGMGNDGADGLLALRSRGGRTLGQDEASSAVFGMPRAAQLQGALDGLVPLDGIAAAVLQAVREIRR